MRKLYCLLCASPIEERTGRFACTALLDPLQVESHHYSSKLGYSIRRAVYGVDAPTAPPRAPEVAPYLWCPSCTGELEDYDDRERRLQCVSCGLRLPATDQMELLEIRRGDADRSSDPW
ncbi:hypothetical protein [Variovorax sp. PBL-E5]|uniref:hypothetical protein n=1 Tax=Variovorax sp. PBL-E5 TaxID=434014 RepID=UPI0013A53F2A|nr:hypothetical protein [Variovorax sp. PBL-E5]